MDAGINAGSHADRGRPAAAGEVHDARSAQPFCAGAAGAGRRPAGRRVGHVRLAVRRPAIAVHDPRTHVPTTRNGSGINLAGADHLRTFGIPLRGGRMFDASEVRRGDRVAVINEAAVRLWPAGENPIGARLRLGVLERPPARTLADTTRPPEVTIVGVIANTRNAGLRADPAPFVVMPYSVIAQTQRTLAVRTRRRSQPAPQPGARAGAGDGRGSAARPADHDERDPRAGSHPAAVHDGALQRVRGARARARRRGHLQRAVLPRDAPHARARRPDGARRAAPPRARR